MSAHFDGGRDIEGRRLRDVTVAYVEDPTLTFSDSDDSCPASPPPTYYLRVKEGEGEGAWKWRYINIEKSFLGIWTRRGGANKGGVKLCDIKSMRIIADKEGVGANVEISCATDEGGEEVVIVQARSGKESVLWAEVLQENIEIITKRKVALENTYGEPTSRDQVAKLAQLLKTQLSVVQSEQEQQQQQQQQQPSPCS